MAISTGHVSLGPLRKSLEEGSPSSTAYNEDGSPGTWTDAEPSPTSTDGTTAEESLPRRSPELTRDRALALQLELMAAYNSPAFQKNLCELGRKHRPGASIFNSGRRQLIRRAQASVIPRYGFDESEEGVQDMLSAFAAFQEDPDIQVNDAAIKELLSFGASMPKEQAHRMIQKPVTKFVVLDMLRAHFVEFSKAPFQADVRNLKYCADVNARRVVRGKPNEGGSEDPDGYFHLKGRSELAFVVQKVLLPEYGFEPTKEGVLEMIRHCSPFYDDPEVAHLLDQVNEKLGMSPAACKRFRDLLRP